MMPSLGESEKKRDLASSMASVVAVGPPSDGVQLFDTALALTTNLRRALLVRGTLEGAA